MDPVQRALQARLTRRSVLRGTGMGIAGFSLASFLAACGVTSGNQPAGGESRDPSRIFSGEPGKQVNFANWPLYIDQEKVGGEVRHPSLEAFREATGITVNYETVIQSNEEFYGKIQPQLAAGDPTGWDIIVITDGRQFTLLTRNGWVLPLDHDRTPNFAAHAADFAVDPTFDTDNRYSMAWQSGLTGVGVNRDLLNGEVTKLDDLANPDIVGRNSVGMITGDMADFVMINLGIDPADSGPDEWREAADWLLMQRESGVVRKYYDQGYVDDLTNGNLAATMAWSGDVLYYRLWAGYSNLDFVFPEGGAMLWIDNMLIPATSANPIGALEVMDWVYRPEIATMITEWVLYMSPVEGVRDRIVQDAEAAEGRGETKYAAKLRSTADNEFLFPDPDLLGRTKFRRQLTSDDEAEEWDDIFNPISQS